MGLFKLSHVVSAWGDYLPLARVTVLIGPNNTGKSRFLRELYREVVGTLPSGSDDQRRVLVEGIRVGEIDPMGLVKAHNAQPSSNMGADAYVARGLSGRLQDGADSTFNIQALRQGADVPRNGYREALRSFYRGAGNALVAYVDTETRLAVLNEGPGCGPDAVPGTMLQALYTTRTYEAIESKGTGSFSDAFRFSLHQDRTAHVTFSLRSSNGQTAFDKLSEDEHERHRELLEFSRIEDEGSGRRSLAGVVSAMMTAEHRLLLVDEPETFLHPSMARALGRWVAAHARERDQQVVIATHSADFLAGLLQAERVAAGDSVAIYRFDRAHDRTSFRQVSKEATARLIKEPLPASLDAFEALFAEGTVIVEGQSDQLVYQALARKRLGDSDILFLRVGGKGSLAPLTGPLRDAAAPTVVVGDLDCINDGSSFTKTLNALGVSPDDVRALEARRKAIERKVVGRPDQDVLTEIEGDLRAVLAGLAAGEYHSLKAIKTRLESIAGKTGKWDLVKKGLDHVDPLYRKDLRSLVGDLEPLGFFLLPVGEAENWTFDGARLDIEKPQWAEAALRAVYDGAPAGRLLAFLRKVLRAARVLPHNGILTTSYPAAEVEEQLRAIASLSLPEAGDEIWAALPLPFADRDTFLEEHAGGILDRQIANLRQVVEQINVKQWIASHREAEARLGDAIAQVGVYARYLSDSPTHSPGSVYDQNPYRTSGHHRELMRPVHEALAASVDGFESLQNAWNIFSDNKFQLLLPYAPKSTVLDFRAAQGAAIEKLSWLSKLDESAGFVSTKMKAFGDAQALLPRA